MTQNPETPAQEEVVCNEGYAQHQHPALAERLPTLESLREMLVSLMPPDPDPISWKERLHKAVDAKGSQAE